MRGLRLTTMLLSLAVLLFASKAEAANIWFVTYGGGTNSHLWTYDPGSQNFTDRGALQGDYWTDIAFGPDGTLYGLRWDSGTGGNAGFYDISDPAKPTELIGSTGINLNSLGWVNGGFFAGDANSGSLYHITESGGSWSMGSYIAFNSAGDIEKDADGNVYAAGWDKQMHQITDHTYNTIGPINDTGGNPLAHYLYGLAYDRDTGIYYGFSNDGQLLGGTTGDSNLYALTFGQSNVTANLILDFDDLTSAGLTSDMVWGATTAPVPIPGAVWLFGSGLIGLAGLRRRAVGRK